MRVITLKNHKGGVGKTTNALHIAAGLAIKGLRVLLIDADAQGHCADQLQVADFGGLYRLLVQLAEWREVLREPPVGAWADSEHPAGRLLLLPSNHETAVIPLATNNVKALLERLDEVKALFDAVVIDTSPTPSLMHAMVDLTTDCIVYPTKCESLSLKGLAASTQNIEQIDANRKAYGLKKTRLIGVLPTMYQDVNAHKYGLDLIEQHFGEKYTLKPIRALTVWRDREYAKQTLFAFAPGHEATAEMMQVVDRVAGHV